MFFLQLVRAFTLLLCFSSLVDHSEGQGAANCVSPLRAFYNGTSERCQCKQGLVGYGDLCCDYASEWNTCTLGGDPVFTTSKGMKFSLSFPCMKLISVTRNKVDRCVVRVNSGERMVTNGAIYPEMMIIAVRKDPSKSWITIRVWNHKIKVPEAGDYTTFWQAKQKGYTYKTRDGILFNIAYNAHQKKIWSFRICGVVIKFRGVVGQSPSQDPRPGICVTYKPTENDVLGYSLCGTSFSRTQDGRIHPDPLTTVVSTVTGDNRQPNYANVCNQVKNIKNGVCKNNINGPVARCSPMMNNDEIRLCLWAFKIRGPKMVRLFGSCVKFQCNRDRAGCIEEMVKNPGLQMCVPKYCLFNP